MNKNKYRDNNGWTMPKKVSRMLRKIKVDEKEHETP